MIWSEYDDSQLPNKATHKDESTSDRVVWLAVGDVNNRSSYLQEASKTEIVKDLKAQLVDYQRRYFRAHF